MTFLRHVRGIGVRWIVVPVNEMASEVVAYSKIVIIEYFYLFLS